MHEKKSHSKKLAAPAEINCENSILEGKPVWRCSAFLRISKQLVKLINTEITAFMLNKIKESMILFVVCCLFVFYFLF